MKLKAFCIRCGTKILKNLSYPLCPLCGGSCSATNRFSSTETNDMYCHWCGEIDYVSIENPLCYECREKKDLKNQ